MKFYYTILLSLLSLSFVSSQTISLRQDDLAMSFPFDARAYDSDPSIIQLKDGTIWVTWHVFDAGNNSERIVARSYNENQLGPSFEITSGPGIYSEPEIISSGDGVVWIFWSEYNEGKWVICGRSITGNRLGEKLTLSSKSYDSPLNVAALAANNSIYVSWSAYENDNFQIVSRRLSHGTWDHLKRISEPEMHSFRPSMSVDASGNVWVFWDTYESPKSYINGRIISPSPGPVIRLSTSGDRFYYPVSAFSEKTGLCVAWIKVEDITGGKGAIDQRYTFQMVTYKNGKWERISDDSGNDEAAVITRGLLAKITPEHVPTGGYLGQRLHPMLLEDNGYLWLVWERKSNQSGSTFKITGDLIGRRFNGKYWEEPKIFHHGLVDYRIPNEATVVGNKFIVVGSDLPQYGVQNYKYFFQSVKEYEHFEQETYEGWSKTTLPMETDIERQNIQLIDGEKKYNLYWMDSHVHSNLSTDAEGPLDQILFYARDRAKIDAVVTQENDYFLTPLTNYDYKLGEFFSNALSDSNFLVFHGFEWTSRLPADKNISSIAPFLWSSHFPNHRTVIYPRSGGPLVRFTDVENDISQLNKIVSEYGGVTHAQHPKFELSGDPVEIAVEAAAGWGTYFMKPEFIHSKLNEGFRFGFVGTTDSHRRNPGLNGGLTGIFAEELSSDAIMEAYKAKRFYATNGSKIALEARADGILMGQEVIPPANKVTLTLKVNSPRPIKKVTLVRDGGEIRSFSTENQSKTSFVFEDNELEKGTHWYYWRVEIEGNSEHYGGNVMVAKGNLAWSTPNWVIIN